MKLQRLDRIERSAKVFEQYFNLESESKIDPKELESAMTFVERLSWRTMAVTMLRVHKRAAETEEILQATRSEIGAIAGGLFEIERYITQATRDDLGTAITAAAGKLVAVSAPTWKPKKLAPPVETKAGNAVAPAPVPVPDKPAGIVLTPDPLSIDTRELMSRGAKIAAERKAEVPDGK